MPKLFPRIRALFPSLLLALVLLPLLAACGDDDDPEPTAAAAPTQAAVVAAPTQTAVSPAAATGSPSPVPDAGTPSAATPGGAAAPAAAQPSDEVTAIFQAASQRLAEMQSLHFSVAVDGTTYIDDGRTIQLEAAEGNIVRPDRVQASFKAQIQGLAISTIRLITVGDQSWTTNIITGDWEPAPTEFGYDPTVLFSDTEGLGFIVLNAPDPVKLDDEQINDRAMFHIQMTGDAALIGPVTSNTMIGYPVAIDVWIDKETYDVVRVILVEGPTTEKDEPATWTINLSRQNDEITIEPPDIEE